MRLYGEEGLDIFQPQKRGSFPRSQRDSGPKGSSKSELEIMGESGQGGHYRTDVPEALALYRLRSLKSEKVSRRGAKFTT
jgi:hypothetical protein